MIPPLYAIINQGAGCEVSHSEYLSQIAATLKLNKISFECYLSELSMKTCSKLGGFSLS